MANEGDERRSGMDLNLYLGLPVLPLPRVSDLGSDLALGLLSSEEPAVDMPVLEDHPADERLIYSPRDASFSAQSAVLGREPQDDYFQSGNFNQPSSSIPFHVVVPFTPGDEPLGAEEAARVAFSTGLEGVVSEPLAGGELPFTSSYLSTVPLTQVRTELPVVAYQPSAQSSDVFANGVLSLRQTVADMPERIRSLIESNRHVSARRFRSTLSHADDHHSLDAAAFSTQDQNLSDTNPAPQGAVESSRKSKGNEDGVGKDDMEEEKEEKNAGSVSFDCNICFDVANEPVVTSCGHLFCWPCLYQWLHQYSDHKECPICKGQVSDANITPIYAHGSKEAVVEVIPSNNGDPELEIPPRPRGHRFESLRQRIHRPFSRGGSLSEYRRFMVEESRNSVRFDGILDPVAVITRRLEEGVSSLQRHHLDEGLQSGSRADRYLDPSMQQIIDPLRGMTRLRARARRLVRRMSDNQPTQQVDQSELEAELNQIGGTAGASDDSLGRYALQNGNHQDTGRQDIRNPQDSDNIVVQPPAAATQSAERVSATSSTSVIHEIYMQRLAAMHAQLSRLVSSFPGSSIGPTMASLTGNRRDIERQDIGNPQDSDNIIVQPPAAATQSAEQVSASSTMAVIQGDAGVTDTSVEPYRAGTARAARIRGRNGASCSLDVDGENQTNKRRRLD